MENSIFIPGCIKVGESSPFLWPHQTQASTAPLHLNALSSCARDNFSKIYNIHVPLNTKKNFLHVCNVTRMLVVRMKSLTDASLPACCLPASSPRPRPVPAACRVSSTRVRTSGCARVAPWHLPCSARTIGPFCLIVVDACTIFLLLLLPVAS